MTSENSTPRARHDAPSVEFKHIIAYTGSIRTLALKLCLSYRSSRALESGILCACGKQGTQSFLRYGIFPSVLSITCRNFILARVLDRSTTWLRSVYSPCLEVYSVRLLSLTGLVRSGFRPLANVLCCCDQMIDCFRSWYRSTSQCG